MGRKYEKREKSRGKEKHETSEPRTTRENAPSLCGCPVPEPIECAVGMTAEDCDEGVVMECSNVRCPYVETKIHLQCFRAFEDHLVKLMSNIGSARGWTDAQRRSNLWEKKGQSLVAKVCRCRCGLGTTRRDDIILYNQKKTVAPPVNVTPATNPRKKKTKELPKLNFGVMKTTGNLEEKGRPRKTSRRREVSSSTVSSVSHLYNHEYEYIRDSVTYHTDSTAISVMSYNPNDIDDNMSDCSRNEVFYDSQESPQNASSTKLSKSYASAIKTSSVVSEEHVEAISVDSGVEMKSSATTVSDCSDDIPKSLSMTVSNCSEDSPKELLSPDIVPETPKSSKKWTERKKSDKNLNSFLDFEIGVSTTSTPLVPKQNARIFSELLVPNIALTEELTHYFSIREDLDISEIPEWDLFTGSNFGIGETIIGLTALPGFYNSFQENIQVV
ncbi:unnamed protein product [Auanema sp. JU1783]|nr:unnamed protein product [Auanema sp. JU1783]